jgi:hypothetical protein
MGRRRDAESPLPQVGRGLRFVWELIWLVLGVLFIIFGLTGQSEGGQGPRYSRSFSVSAWSAGVTGAGRRTDSSALNHRTGDRLRREPGTPAVLVGMLREDDRSGTP